MRNKSKKITKRMCICLLSITGLVLGCFNSQAQDPNYDSFSGMSDPGKIIPCQLISFKTKRVENKNYVSWLIKSVSDNYYFVLERSVDGEEYAIVKIKKCLSSPPGIKLLYTYTDDDTLSPGIVYYRLRLREKRAVDTDCMQIMLSYEDYFEKHPLSLINLKIEVPVEMSLSDN